MNILYIDHYAGSSEMGMEFRPYYLSKEWVKMGHSVTVIAGDYSHLRKKNPNVKSDFQREIIDGIEYIWIITGEYEGNGAKRAITMERFVRKLLIHSKFIAKKWKPDVVIASSTYPLDTYPAQKIAKLAKAKYIHEVHDMWPATLYEVGGMSRIHPFVIAMQIAENSAYKHCDKCVALLPYSKDYMIQHGLDPEKFINIQNGVVEEEWDSPMPLPEEHIDFFSKHENQFIVGYFGGHALSNALGKSLDVAKVFLEIDKNIIFVFVGDGVEKKNLIERAKRENITNVFFLPPVPKKSIPNLLKHFDCSYMTGMSSPLYRFGLCLNKMYDSMMAGIPIICAFDVTKTQVSIYNCGRECNPSKTKEVVDCIMEIYNMGENKRKELGYNGVLAVKNHFTYKQLAKEFINCF
ncbi:MAG: glycosyltransferase family 4 protein [Saccharofermentans sp.]|nr:glycosyltransferase family 4 protein [Saccharofermentans sp.]